MRDRAPEFLSINHDDYCAKHVGRTDDGRQFFLTNPFMGPNKTDNTPGAEFLALFTFDDEGILLDARIENFGPRDTMDVPRFKQLRQKWLDELGPFTFQRIEIAPFSVERFGTQFGLILSQPEGPDGTWHVTMEPGNYMAFFPPWDSGEYDT
jgi:hypothetical protein